LTPSTPESPAILGGPCTLGTEYLGLRPASFSTLTLDSASLASLSGKRRRYGTRITSEESAPSRMRCGGRPSCEIAETPLRWRFQEKRVVDTNSRC
jgi:hypothetical protein